jgi:hypothetical protein
MNELDVSPPALKLSTDSHSGLNPGPRLIVLFPASEANTPDLSNRIWEIAQSLSLNVLILSLSNDFAEESRLRRKLIGMAAVIKDPKVSTDIMIEHGNDWVKQVTKIWHEGDILACFSGYKVGFMRQPLDQILGSSLQAPIYILSDYQPTTNPASTFILRAMPWLGSLAILGGFLWAEIKIVQLPQDWAHTALIYICIFVEAALIYFWNSLFT